MKNLEEKAKEIRRLIFQTICDGGGGHIAASLSIVEILTVLYYGNILRINPEKPADPERDRFILSKGHACVTLYAVLADKGFFSKEHLATFGSSKTILGGHPDMHKIPGVEATTGALGHGFPFGVGMALAGKLDKKSYKVFVVLGDGECQEGSIWEAVMFASHHKLDNLTAIIDYNKIQAMDHLDNIVSLGAIVEKWNAFGWEVTEVCGHDITQLQSAFEKLPFSKEKPSPIIADTIKGKGISFMEHSPIWHYRMHNEEEMRIACEELGIEYSA